MENLQESKCPNINKHDHMVSQTDSSTQ